MKKILVLLFFLLMPCFVFAQGQPEYDLAMKSNDLVLSKADSNLIAGETIRVYATVINNGQKDAAGVVAFFVGGKTVGTTAVSVRVGGVKDEVYVDFTLPSSDFNIMAKVVEVDPRDDVLTNNEALSRMFHVQTDADSDGQGDEVDADDDNDSVSDVQETQNGTNPNSADSDKDGVADGTDAFPLDPKKQTVEPIKPVVVPPAQKEEPKAFLPKLAEQTKKVVAPIIEKVTAETADSGVVEAEREKEIEQFYKSPQVELLKSVNISATQINWNKFDFSFTTNSPDIKADQLSYVWDFGDGSTSVKNGEHTFYSAGDNYITLKVKGPFNNDLYASYKITIKFFSVYNYWLWLIILGILGIIALYISYLKDKVTARKKRDEDSESI